MVETILQIQQMLSESKFVEAQKLCELEFHRTKSSWELREVYFESLIAQQKEIPSSMLLEHIESLFAISTERAEKWLLLVPKKDHEFLLLQIRLCELKGRMEELYQYLSSYQIERYCAKAPVLPQLILQMVDKYFREDFKLRLQQLALDLMRMDLLRSEQLIIKLIRSCYERSSARGTKKKIESLLEVLKTQHPLYHLEIYKNLCQLLIGGITEKKDFKRIIELVIYLEEFELQTILLDFLYKNQITEIASSFANVIHENKKYNFVYLDKYFPHLKSFFHKKIITSISPNKSDLASEELRLTDKFSEIIIEEESSPIHEDEFLLAHFIRHQCFNSVELYEIATSFLQSEYYHAALQIAKMGEQVSENDVNRLKSAYLKVTCLLKLGDYRAVIDTCLSSLRIATTQNDILCFLYAQADAYFRLKEYGSSREILRKILAINPSYRLAREKLEQLNAI